MPADDILKYFSSFFLENGIWHLMQIGDNLHETLNLIFWEKGGKCLKFVIFWIYPLSGKGIKT